MKLKKWSIRRSRDGYNHILQGWIFVMLKIHAKVSRLETLRIGLIVYVHGIPFMCYYGYEESSKYEETKSCIDTAFGSGI